MEQYQANIINDGIAIGFFINKEDARAALKFCKSGFIQVN